MCSDYLGHFLGGLINSNHYRLLERYRVCASVAFNHCSSKTEETSSVIISMVNSIFEVSGHFFCQQIAHFCENILENPPSIFDTICPRFVLTGIALRVEIISVSTSHMLRFGGEALSRAEPPAGPLKFNVNLAHVTFSKISIIFRCDYKTSRYE